jgi:thiopeptide-type bacteriocin biosynthesis protein
MSIKRRFVIGEEWLYIKVYSGPSLLEGILSDEIYEVVKSAYEDALIDKFFFVRYVDESYHLRLRFHVTDVKHVGFIVNNVSKGLKDYVHNGMIAKVTADTYSREIERYGKLSMEHLETVFSVNSWQVMELLRSAGDYEQRTLEGIKIIDDLLDLFGLNIQAKYNLFESYYRSYFEEFGKSDMMLEQLKKTNREYSKKIIAMLDDRPATAGYDSSLPFIGISHMEKAVQHILQLKNDQVLEVSFENLLRSIVHMHFNRVFRVKQRMHELVIYYMFSNYYKSLGVRQKMKSAVPAQQI